MKKCYCCKILTGSLFVMMGVYLIFSQGVSACPIVSFSDFHKKINLHALAVPWLSQLDFTGSKKDTLSNRNKEIVVQEIKFVKEDMWEGTNIPAWGNIFYGLGRFTHGITTMLYHKEGSLKGTSSPYLIYDPASLNSAGLEQLLDHTPGIDIDFLKTFLSGLPHGKWSLTDILTASVPLTPPVPEPSTMLILGSGMLGVACFGRFKK